MSPRVRRRTVPAGQPSAEEYRLEGVLLSVASRSSSTRQGTRAATVTTWLIKDGEIAGRDVSGLVVLAVRSPGDGHDPGTADLLLDERATPEQVAVVRDAFEGRYGGPLAGLVDRKLERRRFHLLPVESVLDDQRAVIRAPGMVAVAVEFVAERWTPATGHMALTMPDHPLCRSVTPTSVERATFRIEHRLPSQKTRRDNR